MEETTVKEEDGVEFDLCCSQPPSDISSFHTGRERSYLRALGKDLPEKLYAASPLQRVAVLREEEEAPIDLRWQRREVR